MKSLCPTDWIDDRAQNLAADKFGEAVPFANRVFWFAVPSQLILALGGTWLLASVQSPTANTTGLTMPVLLAAGICLTCVALVFLWGAAESKLTPYVIAAVQVTMSMGMIISMEGRLEAWGHGFVTLALLTLYQNSKMLIGSSVLLAGIGLWYALSGDNLGADSPAMGLPPALLLSGWYLVFAGFQLLVLKRNERQLLRFCRGQASFEQASIEDEQLIWTRTKELKIVNRQLHEEVHTRVRAENDRERLTRKLLQASRQAGLSEVATGVLHSVGNVVNSINISTDLICTRLNELRPEKLEQAIALLGPQKSDWLNFLQQDSRSDQLPQFVGLALTRIKDQQTELVEEVQLLRSNVDHISEIVSLQQNYARVVGASEKFSVTELCDRALRIHQADLDRLDITVDRDYQKLPPLYSEPNKILQIIVDLVSNAIHALQPITNHSKKVRIATSLCDRNVLRINVQDNGVGIVPENRRQILQHGFTTRSCGNGFGLHNSMLAAHELNGSLECFSDGVGQGARFELALPIEDSPNNVINAVPFLDRPQAVEIPVFQ